VKKIKYYKQSYTYIYSYIQVLQFGMFKLLSHKGPETAGAPVATEWTGAALVT